MNKFSFYRQRDAMDCGPTCLRMVAKHYGKNISLNTLRNETQIGKDGVNLLGISEAAEKIGFRTRGVKISFEELINGVPKPAILHWRQNHFVVAHPKSFPKGRTFKNRIEIADPATGLIKLSKGDFKNYWLQTNNNGEAKGIALLLEPTPAFYKEKDEKEDKVGWGALLGYLKQQKKLMVQLFMGLLVGSLLQLIFPFLTQSIVDTGINTHNLQFIYIILIAQFMLFFGRTVVDFIRSRILLYISTRINVSLLSDFWIKLMRLPLHFFDTKQTGDILQRLQDQHRIENFLTGSTLSTLFSLVTLFIFSIVLLIYNTTIFFIFAVVSILYVLWICFFLKYRRSLDYKRFAVASKENSATMQLIHGMQEIKLNNAEHLKRWEWEGLQASLFKLSFKSLSLSQYQQAGAFFINEGKNIFITFLVAKLVLEGQLTLGAMLAIQYIIGQLNSPIEQLIGFTQQAQDAKISLERLNEIYQVEDEEATSNSLNGGGHYRTTLPKNKSIEIQNLSFTYAGAGNEAVLKNINLIIPEGKVTAIVGMSGSGKTTLLKLLLKFYEHYKGEIKTGEMHLKYVSPKFWRNQCGSVMQDGFIFSDSIAKNIAVSDENPNYQKLLHACKVANILSFVESLPLGFNTKIGPEGTGISAGQKQRILIARAVYKDPHYLFFDEATNSLDANNEKEIIENLQEFFSGRTVVIVAHRLSTVKHADNIVVLHEGIITEQGTHEELSKKKGEYYHLVKNQLELGN
ncbi:MAG: peptidase domain-containing ABC transporter [Chitinophagaceae bacterium]